MTENEKLQYFKQLLINQHYSPKTVKSYTQCIRSFFLWYKQSGDAVDDKIVAHYITILIEWNKAPKTTNLYKEALKKYFLLIYNRTFRIALQFSREARDLPIVLSTQEVKRIIDVISNPKHRLLLSLAYGCGFRVSEIVNLRRDDIDADRHSIHIKHGKWEKDRIVILPLSVQSLLETHKNTTFSSP